MNNDDFDGFEFPKENWSKLPHQLIESLSKFSSLGELMVVIYILRHTWGFQEFDQFKKITLDEFMHGRRTKERKRMNGGVGMSKNAIIRGLERAENHGFIKVQKDEKDPARIKKYYMLKMAGNDILDVGFQNGTPKSSSDVPKENPDVPKQNSSGSEVEHRSEKDTLERNNKKDTSPIGDEIHDPDLPIEQKPKKKVYVPPCEYEDEHGNIEVIEDDSWRQEKNQLDRRILLSAGLEEYPSKKDWEKARRIEQKLERGEICERYLENRCYNAENLPWGLDKLLNSLLNKNHYRNWQEREAERERRKERQQHNER